MSTEVVLPQLGAPDDEAIIARWRKAVGDRVEQGEPLLEVSTAKVDTEIPAPVSGVLRQVLFGEDDAVAPGAVLAIIGEPPRGVVAPIAPQPNATPLACPVPPRVFAEPSRQFAPPPVPPPELGAAPLDTPYVTPQMRRLADQLGIDITTVTGTGVGGRLRKQDLLNANPAPAEPPAATPGVATPSLAPPDPRRGTASPLPSQAPGDAGLAPMIAALEIDITDLRERDPSRRYIGQLLAALAATLNTMAQFNASIVGNAIIFHSREDIGIVIDTPYGPLTPVIHDADGMTEQQLNDAVDDLRGRTAAGTLRDRDLTEPTFTVRDDGRHGIAWATASIGRTQLAALGIGQITSRPLGDTTREFAWLTVSYDPHVIDAPSASLFLSRLRDAATAR